VTARRLLFVTFFGIAMGFLEAAVVVYLRLLYYPDGFDFPLIQLPWSVAVVELARESATLVMLASVAILAGRTNWERFAWFAYLFGVWDIIYYVGLKMMLNWPESLLTWDILFLLPLIWVGPVLAPLLISAALVTAALVILHHEGRRIRIHLVGPDWPLLAIALGLCLYSFMANHVSVFHGGLPGRFPWATFLLGLFLGVGVLLKAVMMNPRGRLPRRYGLK
jgi:hypothetical protein